jgi:hypothetical protein
VTAVTERSTPLWHLRIVEQRGAVMKRFLAIAAVALALAIGTTAVMTVTVQQAFACSDGW